LFIVATSTTVTIVHDAEQDVDAEHRGSFPRGGSGPVVPLPKGATVSLLLLSLAVLGTVLAILAWLFV